jgi:hypothetical protein
MSVASGELVQVTFVCQQNGQQVENVFMFRERDGLSTDAQISASVRSAWGIYRAVIVDDVTVIELRWKYMTPVQLDGNIIQPTAGQENGAHGGDATNSMLALVSTIRTGVAGKRHRGRVYTFGLPAGSLVDNQNKASSTYLTEFATMWGNWQTAYDDAAGTDTHLAHGIYSRVIGGTSPYTVAGWQASTQYVPHVILGTQRRRREGVGV